jgi:hypothetical protein
MRVAGRCAVWNDRNGQRCGVRWAIFDLHIEHGRQTAQALRANPQRIDLVADLQTQRFDLVLWAAGTNVVNVDGIEQRLFREHHGFFRGAANPDA